MLLHGTISASIFIIPRDDKDFGFYTCTASNALGTDAVYVQVVRTGKENTTLQLELNIQFECRIVAFSSKYRKPGAHH